jgi:hypothetical protein
MYAAILVVRKPNQAGQATRVPGRFPSAGEARRYAIDYGVARIAARDLPKSCSAEADNIDIYQVVI